MSQSIRTKIRPMPNGRLFQTGAGQGLLHLRLASVRNDGWCGQCSPAHTRDARTTHVYLVDKTQHVVCPPPELVF